MLRDTALSIAMPIACDAIYDDDNTNTMRLPTISPSIAIEITLSYSIDFHFVSQVVNINTFLIPNQSLFSFINIGQISVAWFNWFLYSKHHNHSHFSNG